MQPMHLSTLLTGTGITVAAGDRDRTVADLCDDSRHVVPGGLFIARKGAETDGAQFIGDAVANGAATVLTAPGIEVSATGPDGGSITHLVCDAPGAWVGELAARFFGRPAERLHLLGVTGTNGKTTTVYMIRHLLNGVGKRCGMISTIEIDDGAAQCEPADLTTPGAIDLQRIFRRMVDHGCTHCVMECSSHALDQGRLAGLSFSAAVFTNLSGDHLDYHQTMDAYGAAKAKLFAGLAVDATAIINDEDRWSPRMVADCKAKVWRFAVSPAAQRPDLFADILEATADGSSVRLDFWDETLGPLRFPLVGRHNVDNLLGAVGAVASVTGRFADLEDAIRTMPPVPGRLERVTAADEPFTVLVDYAHTDDALRNVLEGLRPLVPAGAELRVLFGCGGERDETKRPRMAQVACELADAIRITSDNPRGEDREAIISAILTGVPAEARKKVATDPDRRKAIGDIIREAGTGDIVLIAGKGHEDYQEIAGVRHPFDDRVEARAALDRLRETDSTE